MIHVVCCIKDRCAKLFAQPFFSPTLEHCIRSFRHLVNDPQAGTVHSNAEDFDLFHIGTFDDETARFTNLELPVQVAMGREMLKPLAPLAPG